MKMVHAMAMTGVLVAAASCAPKQAPVAERPPIRIEVPAAPAVPPPPPPPVVGWEDMALTAGEWRFDPASLTASYGGLFALRCDLAGRRISLTHSGTTGALVVRTSFGARALAAGAALPATDPLLDQILFSRGRFAVEADGQTRLVLPTWPEPARVVEECRG